MILAAGMMVSVPANPRFRPEPSRKGLMRDDAVGSPRTISRSPLNVQATECSLAGREHGGGAEAKRRRDWPVLGA
jgi:hypothetical protein